MHYCKVLFVLIMLLPGYLFAQQTAPKINSISGLWTGTIYNDSAHQDYKYELAISMEKGKYIGYSHTWFTIEGTAYFAVKKVSVKFAKDKKLVVVDEELIDHNLPELPVKYSKQLNVLDIQFSGDKSSLQGIFVTNRTKQFQSLTGTVKLQFNKNFGQSALIPTLKKLSINNELTQNEMAYKPASNTAVESK